MNLNQRLVYNSNGFIVIFLLFFLNLAKHVHVGSPFFFFFFV